MKKIIITVSILVLVNFGMVFAQGSPSTKIKLCELIAGTIHDASILRCEGENKEEVLAIMIPPVIKSCTKLHADPQVCDVVLYAVKGGIDIAYNLKKDDMCSPAKFIQQFKKKCLAEAFKETQPKKSNINKKDI